MNQTNVASLSVVVTCYNQKAIVQRAVESVLSQRRAEVPDRIVLVDDGSKDGSREFLEALAGRDSRIVVVAKANGGAASARNAGIAASTGDWIAFLDGDDAWADDKLDAFLDAAARYPGAGIICSDFVECDAELVPSSRVRVTDFAGDEPTALERLFVEGGPILPSAAMIRRAAVERCGGFDERFRYNEDPELWLRIAAHYPIHRIARALTFKRNLPGSLGSHVNALRNWENQKRITDEVLERHPELRSVRHLRLARDHARLAYIHAESGERAKCVGQILAALRYRPLSPKLWSYFIAAIDFRLYQLLKRQSGLGR